jgi:hypothetical protein
MNQALLCAVHANRPTSSLILAYFFFRSQIDDVFMTEIK